jgi:hypothetical protein
MERSTQLEPLQGLECSGFRGRTGRFSGFLPLKRHRSRSIRGETKSGTFDTRDEPELDIVMMCLVQPVAAIVLLEFDAVAFDAIDGADIHTVAHFHRARSVLCSAPWDGP